MAEAITTIADLRRRLADDRRAGRTIAFVPTMGALHEGHLALMRRAHELADVVVVSVFVNPLQFGPGEDLDRYPRTLDEDLHALSRGSFGPERALSHPRGAETPAARVVESAAATIVFAPTAAEMYPEGESQTRV